MFVDGNSIGLENRRTNFEIKITASARCTNVARGEYGSIRRELMILKFPTQSNYTKVESVLKLENEETNKLTNTNVNVNENYENKMTI